MEEYFVDFSGVTDIDSFHASLKKSLPLPEWYGDNLDALFDSLTDLDEACIYFKNCRQAAESIVDYYDSFLNVIADAQMEVPGLFCFLETGSEESFHSGAGEDADISFETGGQDDNSVAGEDDDISFETGGQDDNSGAGEGDDISFENGSEEDF